MWKIYVNRRRKRERASESCEWIEKDKEKHPGCLIWSGDTECVNHIHTHARTFTVYSMAASVRQASICVFADLHAQYGIRFHAPVCVCVWYWACRWIYTLFFFRFFPFASSAFTDSLSLSSSLSFARTYVRMKHWPQSNRLEFFFTGFGITASIFFSTCSHPTTIPYIISI